MGLEERLGELCADGKRTQAQMLAQGAIQKDPILNVTVEDGTLVIETARFVGTHRLREPSTVRSVQAEGLVHPGTYRWKGDEFTLSFSMNNPPPNAKEQAREAILDTGELPPVTNKRYGFRVNGDLW